MVNPLTRCLEDYSLPPFATLRVSDIVPAVRAAIAEMALDVNAIEDDLSDPDADISWATVMDRLEIIDDPVNRLWRIVIHLSSVADSPELRLAQSEVQAEVLTIQSRRAQSVPVFRAMQRLRASRGFHEDLTAEQQRILDRAILDATLNGVALNDTDKATFNAIHVKLKELSNRFDSNVLDSTNAFSYLVHDKAEMDGLPDAIVALTANNAVAAGHDLATATQGPWKFTLDWSLYWAVQRYATSRRLRETIYLANQAIASAAPFDNAPIMQQMIQLRRDRAQLLGFESYAALGLEDKMAPSVSAVQDLIDGMRNKFRPLGEAEVADVSAYAASQGAVLPLQKWDFSFWVVKLRKQRYDLHDDLVQSYFPLPRVLDGLFEFVARLFGLRIEAADTPQETWHPDVQYYQIRALDQPGTPVISQFYLDLYERGDEKKAGAWIEVMVGRSSVLRTDDKAHVRIPVFALMFNFATPAPLPSTTPTLLSFSNVTLLFHCLGYGLRIALTSAEHTAASRPHGVEWDAVEVPSQLMANFCYHRPTIQMVSGHVVTGEPLPDSIFDKLVASRRFVAAVKILPQLQKASLDLSLHDSFDSTASLDSMFALSFTLDKQFDVLPSLESDKSLCSLSHIFSGLYAAGYYSYTWSEVMSSDAYGRFEEAKDEDEWKAVGRDCRDTLFALLGKAHPLDAFKSFRRRPPNADALLKDYGLI